MKTFLLLLLCCTASLLNAQRPKTTEENFQKILALVESKEFRIDLRIATPLNGTNINIDSAYITVKDTLAAGYMPYYSAHYSFPMTGKKGINFDNVILNPSLRVKGKKNRKTIKFQFDIIGKNDSYKLQMDIQDDKTCYLFVTSLKRSPISYIGTLRKL